MMKTIEKKQPAKAKVTEMPDNYFPDLSAHPVVQAKLEKAREDFKKAPFPEHLLRK